MWQRKGCENQNHYLRLDIVTLNRTRNLKELYFFPSVIEIQDAVSSAWKINIAKDSKSVIPQVSNAFNRVVEKWVNIFFKNDKIDFTIVQSQFVSNE